MLRRALFERLGGFDEAFEDCHFEDTDLWMRAVDAGERLGRAPVAVAHGRGKTRTLLSDGANTAFRRNRLIYAEKHRREDGNVPIPTLEESHAP
jgi:GT2 family glycosyltransferase